MISLTSEIGIEDLFAVRGIVMFVGSFGGDKDVIDLGENLRIIERHGPAALPGVVFMQYASAVRYFFHAGLSTPDAEDHVGPELTGILEVVVFLRFCKTNRAGS
jgi:hypothetical protein